MKRHIQKERIFRILPWRLRPLLEREKLNHERLQEIRLRIGTPLIFQYDGKEFLTEDRIIIEEADIKEMLEYVSHYSLYAYEQDMRQGFITVEGGHRVGIAGQVILENGQIKNLKNISSINLRICHEIRGCADTIFPKIIYNNQFQHTLIISPPGCGKTTLLRDVIRQLSNGNEYICGMTVGVVDERSEIGGCYKGVPQNHLGIRTDILDACPKAEGMIMLIRSMRPEVIAVDEIGTEADVHAMEYAMHCGCKMLATVHAGSVEELKKRPLFSKLIQEQRFERYVVLEGNTKVGAIHGIYNAMGEKIDGNQMRNVRNEGKVCYESQAVFLS